VLTNNFALPALTITTLYRRRWQIELFFQVDQATPAHQSVLRHLGERREDSGLDRSVRLCPSRHREEALQARGVAL
jgi:hypothetical protein